MSPGHAFGLAMAHAPPEIKTNPYVRYLFEEEEAVMNGNDEDAKNKLYPGHKENKRVMTELLKLFLGGAITKNEYYKRLEQASKDSLQRTAADKIDEVKKLQRKLERALAFTCLLKAMGLFGAKLEEEELDVRLVKPEVEAKVKENDEWVEIRGALPDNGQRALTLENEKLKMVLEQAKKILE